MYMSWGNTNLPAPKLQLVGFKRVYLLKQQSTTVTVDVTSEQMALWLDDTTGWAVSPGEQPNNYYKYNRLFNKL